MYERGKNMKRLLCVIFSALMVAGSASSVYALPRYEEVGIEESQTITASISELWTQFAEAEAYKKLYEMQEKAVKEQLRLYEGPGAAAYLYQSGTASQAYAQWSELKSQESALKLKKEQYEWQKKQAEASLKLLGEKPGKAELQYALYTGTLTPSGLAYDALLAKRYSLQMQEEQNELEKKNLEYQYQLGQIDDSSFISGFAAAVLKKEESKQQREQIDAEIEYLYSPSPAGPAAGPLLP